MAAFAARITRIVRENWLLFLIVGAVLVAFLVLRTPASSFRSVAEVDAVLSNGQPTLIEFYSNT